MTKRLLAAIAALLFACTAHAANPRVEMKTSQGDIVLELYPDKAPKTVENFLAYAKSGFYKGTQFHRVIDGFMIQGGGYDRNFVEKATRAPIQNEADNGLKNQTYTIAMARTFAPHSATSQFFINVADNAPLDFRARTLDGYGYCVFGKVVKGENVVQAIARLKTGPGGPFPTDVPQPPVIIEEVKVVE